MGAGHSAEDGGPYASDPPARDTKKIRIRRRRHSVDSVASYSSQNHVDRIRAQNFSAASCHDESDFGSIKTSLFRRSSSNLEYPNKRPESVTSNSSSTRSRLRELVERKSSQDEHKSAANTVGDIQYFENPTETLEFDRPRNSLESKKSQEERPKKRKLSKSKEKEVCETKNKKQEKYQSKLAEYYQIPVQLPQDEFYQHLTRSKAAEDLLQKRFSNSDTEFSGSYGRLCKHREPEVANLRRSRSLAVIREETFTDLQLQNHAKSKRSQLIPRARLFDKPCFKERLIGRAKYQNKEDILESIYIDSTVSCFGEINAQKENENPDNPKNKSNTVEVTSVNGSQSSRSVGGSWPNLTDEIKQNHHSEDSIGHSRNPSEIDSLDSNYVRKHYNFEAHRKSLKEGSPDTDRSIATPNPERLIASPIQHRPLTSPNHYKELYVITDEPGSDTEEKGVETSRSPKLLDNNLNVKKGDADILVTDILSDTVKADEGSIKGQDTDDKKSTIPEIVVEENPTNNVNDIQSVASENDEILSSPPDSITSYISISIASSDKSHKLEHLANSLAEKIDEYCDSQFKDNDSIPSNTTHSDDQNLEIDPIYTTVNNKKSFADIRKESFLKKNGNLFNELLKNQNNDIYVSNTYIESDNYSTKSYCTSKNITTEPFVTTLIENQYCSLPDINISKCLRKSERIDAQLREEDTEDIIPCENTYEIAQSNFRDILTVKGTENYGQLNKTFVKSANSIKIPTNNCIYLPEFSESQLIGNFNKLEDDLKSIITIDSSNADDKEINFFRSDNHQNEREINEIEGTIRNNKVITKSESLKVSNYDLRPEINILKSLSNDNIKKLSQDKKKSRAGIKKHYSLRQRDPSDDETNRIPSPETVEKSLTKVNDTNVNTLISAEESKTNSLLSRVQSFKTTAESNIAILPLSGHQTIVIDPPLKQETNENNKQATEISNEESHIKETNIGDLSTKPGSLAELSAKLEINKDAPNRSSETCIDTSSYYTPRDPFITIKLNKVVKTTIPKLKKETSEKVALAQNKFAKPPSKLIIKDNNNCSVTPLNTFKKANTNMTRPQVLQVIDSKNKKQNIPSKMEILRECVSNDKPDCKSEIKELKQENTVKEKLTNAIKTDIEYQEKISSVKNYWSKLVDNNPEHKDPIKQDTKSVRVEDLNNNNDNNKKETKNTENIKEDDSNKCLSEISVGSIIKSLESVKIVDSIRKISQTKLHLWKDESEKVKSDSEIEEPTLVKVVKEHDTKPYDKSDIKRPEIDQSRDTPEIEIVELSSESNENQKTQATIIKARSYEKGCDDFDHVRYKVMKSELFKNSMIANYKKEAQFDGLLQYLQDYSFQELLVNNNIVIIEPVRTKIEPAPRKNTNTCKISPNLLKRNDNSPQTDKPKNAVKRHFFYHPIRVNKEIIEEELPNPDTVKKVRNLFEDTLKMKSPMSHDPPLIEENIGLTRRASSHRNLSEDIKSKENGGRKRVVRQLTIDTNFGNKKWDNASLSSGVSSGDLSSNNEYENEGLSPYSQRNLKDNTYSSSEEYLCDSMNQDFCCESQYVSPDILKKIRDCGTSVTYYGGKVLNSKTGSAVSPMTKAIMDEIKSLQKNCSRDCYSCQTKCRGDKCSCLVSNKHKQMNADNLTPNLSVESNNQSNQDQNKRSEGYPAFKFKLVKSNSCSSRLELAGADEGKNPRTKYMKQLSREDPPLIGDDENSVKNKIYRLESYNKGIVRTPFEVKNKEIKKDMVKTRIENIHQIEITAKKTERGPEHVPVVETKIKETVPEEKETEEIAQDQTDNSNANTFESKFYYVNDDLDQKNVTTGKFGEMVFEEFEVLESCYDSLNSNKSLK